MFVQEGSDWHSQSAAMSAVMKFTVPPRGVKRIVVAGCPRDRFLGMQSMQEISPSYVMTVLMKRPPNTWRG